MKKLIYIIAVLFVGTDGIQKLNAQTVFNVNGNKLAFSDANMTASSGNGESVGDYLFYEDVITISSTQIDCIVKVKSISNLSSCDDFDFYTSGEDDFFAPRLTFSSSGYVAYEFNFIEGGTFSSSTVSGTAVQLINAIVNIYDIDGNNHYQYNEIQRVYSYLVSSSTKLNVSYNSSTGRTRFESTVTTNSTTTTNSDYRAQVNYDTISVFDFVVGTTSGGGAAYFYIDFSVGPTFTGAISGGSISENQTICYNGNPAAFSSVSAAAGFSGTVNYRWQYSTDGGNNFADISSTNSTTYDPPSGLTSVTKYRRKAWETGSDTAYSNTVTVDFYTTYTWAGTSSSSYKTAGNWVQGCVPRYKDNIDFATSPSNKCTLDSSVSLTNVTIGGTSSNHIFDLNGYYLELFGVLSTSGTNVDARAITSELKFSGSAAQTLPASSLVNNTIANLTVDNSNGLTLGGTTDLTQKLSMQSGVLTTGGYLTFKSTADYTAIIEEVSYSNPISGNVTVEKYIPAKRAFRLLGSTVNTTTTINANWQEGASAWNSNPSPGYGTHITGSTAGSNGFDATITGNYSLFTFNNSTQKWGAVTNTNTNTLSVGTAYRLMVRGDRTVNIYQGDNNPTPKNTTIRSTGTLHTGNYSVSGLSTTAGTDNFVVNPYQCPVDIPSLLSTSTDINTTYAYMWDPFVNTRGAFSTITLSSGAVSPSGSTASKYLMPAQAFFVKTTSTGTNLSPSITFTEADKFSGTNSTSTTSLLEIPTSYVSSLEVTLINSDSMVIADGLAINFNSAFSNELSDLDAIKAWNLDEVIGTSLNEKVIAVQSRRLPGNWDVIPIYTSQYRATNYKFRIQKTELTPYTIMLVDHFTQETITLKDGETEYDFNIISGNEASSAKNRFEIIASKDAVAENGYLSVVNRAENNIAVSPNPASDRILIDNLPFGLKEVEVTLNTVLGKQVARYSAMVQQNSAEINFNNLLPGGIYVMSIKMGDHTINRKIQIQ